LQRIARSRAVEHLCVCGGVQPHDLPDSALDRADVASIGWSVPGWSNAVPIPMTDAAS
jgi:hypothetical protein